jgi:hypothetical protein
LQPASEGGCWHACDCQWQQQLATEVASPGELNSGDRTDNDVEEKRRGTNCLWIEPGETHYSDVTGRSGMANGGVEAGD